MFSEENGDETWCSCLRLWATEWQVPGLIPSWAPGNFSIDLILLSALSSPGVHLTSDRNEYQGILFGWRAASVYGWHLCCPGCAKYQSKDASLTFHPPSDCSWLVTGKLMKLKKKPQEIFTFQEKYCMFTIVTFLYDYKSNLRRSLALLKLYFIHMVSWRKRAVRMKHTVFSFVSELCCCQQLIFAVFLIQVMMIVRDHHMMMIF